MKKQTKKRVAIWTSSRAHGKMFRMVAELVAKAMPFKKLEIVVVSSHICTDCRKETPARSKS